MNKTIDSFLKIIISKNCNDGLVVTLSRRVLICYIHALRHLQMTQYEGGGICLEIIPSWGIRWYRDETRLTMTLMRTHYSDVSPLANNQQMFITKSEL